MSMQFTYYMLPEEFAAHDASVVSECNGVITELRDGRIGCIASRVESKLQGMRWNLGFTRPAFINAIQVMKHVTSTGITFSIDHFRSPVIEAHVFPFRDGVLRRQRLYSLTATDFRGQDLSFDVEEYVTFAQRFMRRWKKGLKYVRWPELPDGYYSPGALDAIARGVATAALN